MKMIKYVLINVIINGLMKMEIEDVRVILNVVNKLVNHINLV